MQQKVVRIYAFKKIDFFFIKILRFFETFDENYHIFVEKFSEKMKFCSKSKFELSIFHEIFDQKIKKKVRIHNNLMTEFFSAAYNFIHKIFL